MRRTERSPIAPKSPEAGFSFVEILVTLLLLSALGLVLLSGLVGAQGLLRKTIQRTAFAVKILQVDTALRQAMGRVRVPFWLAPESAVSQEGSLLAISFLDGDPQQRLTLELRDGRIRIAQSGGAWNSFGPFPGAGLKLFRDEAGRPQGVEVSIDRGGETTRILARFGCNPL
jgi:type II secretory pathway pseudopilin PulG